MKNVWIHILCGTIILALLSSCQLGPNPKLDSELSPTANPQVTPIENNTGNDPVRIHKEAMELQDRFPVPDGYRRVREEDGSFPAYLRRLPLKEHGATVRYYNGGLKHQSDVYEAVINMDIGTKDLQQCADAVIRLRGEYLYKSGALKDIRFHLTNGFLVEYEKWMKGYRVAVDGNRTSWVKKYEPSDTYSNFMNYMEFVFIYAGTLSLEKELVSIPYESMQIGDVMIQGGSPGHAVIIIDMAEHIETGQKLYMLAQSYMPAQDIQVLANPNDDNLSPWYRMETELTEIRTPEWTFDSGNLKRFP